MVECTWTLLIGELGSNRIGKRNVFFRKTNLSCKKVSGLKFSFKEYLTPNLTIVRNSLSPYVSKNQDRNFRIVAISGPPYFLTL